jgi:hypothetical protein
MGPVFAAADERKGKSERPVQVPILGISWFTSIDLLLGSQ